VEGLLQAAGAERVPTAQSLFVEGRHRLHADGTRVLFLSGAHRRRVRWSSAHRIGAGARRALGKELFQFSKVHEGPGRRRVASAGPAFEEELREPGAQVRAVETRRQGRGLQVGRRPLVERDEPLPEQVGVDGERGGVARSENHPLRAAGLVELFNGETAPLNLLKFLGVFLVDEGHDDPGHGHRRDVRRGGRTLSVHLLRQAGAEGLQLLKGSSHRVDAGLLLPAVRQEKLL